jgi:O-antigen biosynthesis protein
MATSTVTGPAQPEGPLEAPPAHADTRTQLATEFLRGSGLEIGAMNWPLAVPSGVQVTYVDHMSVEDQRTAHPELEVARVDVIDDGERLETFVEESVDFIIANHFMEHTEDPIGTIETHLNKLRPGGILFYAVPDKRYTFDFRRPRTTLDHLIADYEHGPEASRWDHFLEWERMVYEPGTAPPDEQQVRRKAAEDEATGYSIHFHVWTQADLLELLLYCQERFGAFDIEAFTRRSIENIAVLRRHGQWVPASSPETTRPVTEVAGPLHCHDDGPRSAANGAVRLSALRMNLDQGSASASWPVGAEGIDGRALAHVADAPISFELRLDGPATFSAHVRLEAHDWRDLRGSVRPWVAAVDTSGAARRLWSGLLTCAADGGEPNALRMTSDLPASTRTLVLGCDRLPPRRGQPVNRAFWTDAELLDPSAPPMARRPGAESTGGHETGAAAASSAPVGPMFSVLTPVHDPPAAMIEEAILSVLDQSLSDWELCLVDDGSTDPDVMAVLQRHAAGDARVRLLRRDTPGGIASATNAALALATGRYVAMLDHDDLLAPDALERVAQAIAVDPGVKMLYSDEDVIQDGRRIWRHLKPDWSPETICTSGYTCHLAVYRRSLMLDLGGFRSDFDGSQDYDFVLRASERVDRVAHIPHVLYRWRAHAGSTAGGDSKQFAFDAARRAIAEHLRRTGRRADVQFADSDGLYRVAPELDPATTAALIVPVVDGPSAPELERAARSWLSQPHAAWTVVLAGASDVIAAGAAALSRAGVDGRRIRTVEAADGADRTTCLAAGAEAADAEQLVLMLSPVTGLTHDWLIRLLGYAGDPEIAAAGPLVLAPDGRFADSGVAITGGMPVFLRHAEDGSNPGQFGFGTAVFNVTAVSEVLATRREAFRTLGGLRSGLGDLALVDYCLRGAERELRTVAVSDARVRSDGAARRASDLRAIRRLSAQHPARAHDPYYNPGYRQDRGDFITRD